MKINRQFQDQHGRGGDVDWVTVQSVERDICLLYHQLADYSYTMSDLSYGTVFALPYWDYLDIEGVPEDQQRFIRDGCLVMLFAMALEVIDGGGAYLTMDKERFLAAKGAVEHLGSRDGGTDRLLRSVVLAFQLVEQRDTDSLEDVEAASTEIHKAYVRRYFERRAEEFRDNPYYRGQGPVE